MSQLFPLLFSAIISWMNVWMWTNGLGVIPYNPDIHAHILGMLFWFLIVWVCFEIANLDIWMLGKAEITLPKTDVSDYTIIAGILSLHANDGCNGIGERWRSGVSPVWSNVIQCDPEVGMKSGGLLVGRQLVCMPAGPTTPWDSVVCQ
jgi:hypothetical protein